MKRTLTAALAMLCLLAVAAETDQSAELDAKIDAKLREFQADYAAKLAALGKRAAELGRTAKAKQILGMVGQLDVAAAANLRAVLADEGNPFAQGAAAVDEEPAAQTRIHYYLHFNPDNPNPGFYLLMGRRCEPHGADGIIVECNTIAAEMSDVVAFVESCGYTFDPGASRRVIPSAEQPLE